MKVITHNLGDFRELEILPLADLHLGDPHSDFKQIQSWLDYIRNTPNAYTILNGDLMDTAIKTSIGDTYGAVLQPMEQLAQCVKIFEPIKDKILAILPGNHELRTYKTDGIDLTHLMAKQLYIDDYYSPGSALLFVSFGEWFKSGQHHRPVTYSIMCIHGNGAGRTEGAKLNRLVQLAAIVDADIYVHSHTHLPLITKEKFYRSNARNKSVALVDKLFVNTSATLNYGGYGELAAFKPSSMDTPIIHLNGTRRQMTATL